MNALQDNYKHHPPSTEHVARTHEYVRDQMLTVAERFAVIIPPCRELSLAQTKLEEAMFWLNAAVARKQVGTAG